MLGKEKMIKSYLIKYKLYNKKNFNLIKNKNIEIRDIEKEVLKLEPKIRNRYLSFIIFSIILILLYILQIYDSTYILIILIFSVAFTLGTIINKNNNTKILRKIIYAYTILAIINYLSFNLFYKQYPYLISIIGIILLISSIIFLIYKAYNELSFNKLNLNSEKLIYILKTNNIYTEILYNDLNKLDNDEINIIINKKNNVKTTNLYLFISSILSILLFITINIISMIDEATMSPLILIIYIALAIIFSIYFFITYYKHTLIEFIYQTLFIISVIIWYQIFSYCLVNHEKGINNYFALNNYLKLTLYYNYNIYSNIYMFDGLISIVGLLISISYFIIRYISNRNIKLYYIN